MLIHHLLLMENRMGQIYIHTEQLLLLQKSTFFRVIDGAGDKNLKQ